MKTLFKILILLTIVFMLACAQDDTEPTDLLTEAVAAAPQAIPNNCPAALYKSTNFMRYIIQGTFTLGCEPLTDEIDIHLDGYWIDTHKVTYGEFMFFMDMTGYQPHDEFSVVFYKPEDFNKSPGGTIDSDGNNPMRDANGVAIPAIPLGGAHGQNINALPAQVSYFDALAYAEWVGKRLLTEAEWEKAARGGIHGAPYPWGHEHPTLAVQQFDSNKSSGLTQMANEGAFAVKVRDRQKNWRSHKWEFRPVGSYAPNLFGLFDMAGNGVEWCSDKWNRNAYLLLANGITPDYDPGEFNKMHVVRGGTFQINSVLSHAGATKGQLISDTIHIARRLPGITIYPATFRLAMDGPDWEQNPQGEFVDLTPWANCR